MRKTDLLKTIACGMVISLIMASTVFAGTVSRTKKVRNISTYTDEYRGAVGSYVASGYGEFAGTSVQNITNGTKYYSYYVYRYNWDTKTYDHSSYNSGALPNGRTTEVAINGRFASSGIYDYSHIVQGYASSVYSMATKVDDYTFLAMQYYR